MHTLIRIICRAESAEDANVTAGQVVSDLVERQDIDWFKRDSDTSRWEECWQPELLSSKIGCAWAEEALAAQQDEFECAMRAIRYMLSEYSDEQIFDEDFEPSKEYVLSRHQFYKASGYGAYAAKLYDDNANVILHQRDLESCKRYGGSDLWVVSIDCHI